MGEVILKCIKEGSKLRVRIISPGFNHQANCSFPRAIRVEGRKYSVPYSAISFAEGPRQKFFYRISKNSITILNENEVTEELLLKNLKIFGEDEEMECLICMSCDRDAVFAPCGHYCACETCANTIRSTQGKCPMCRTRIDVVVRKDQIQS